MTWPGYVTAGGVEIINTTRTESYAKEHRLSWFKPIYSNSALPALIGDNTYTDPATDNAIWYEREFPESAEFYGVYPLDITGAEDSTFGGTIMESLGDGGTLTGTRNGTRSTVFNVVLIGASEAGVEYGMQWLKRALNGGCSGRLTSCTGFDLTYFASEPVLGAIETGVCDTRLAPRSNDPVQVAQKLIRTLRRTQVLNGPTISAKKRTTDGGCVWTVGFTVASGSPFEFGAEVPFLENWLNPAFPSPWPTTVEDTNLAYNTSFVTDTTGFLSNNPATYPVTRDTTAPISGIASALTIRGGTLGVDVSSVYMTGRGNATNALPVTPGVPITASLDVRTTQADRNIQITWAWRDAANVALSNAVTVVTQAPVVGTYRHSATATPPDKAAYGYASISVFANAGNAVSGEQVRYDNIKISLNPDTTFFDGSTADTGILFYQWTGTANASTSTKVLAHVPNGNPDFDAPWPTTLEDTNLATNPTFNTSLAGINTNSTNLYPVTLTGTYVIAGAKSAVTTRKSTLNTVASSVWLNGRSSATTALPVTPGVPITLSVDMRTGQNNRNIQGYWSWRDARNAVVAPNSGTTTFQAPTAGIRRVAFTATPPAGAVSGYVVISVVANTGKAVNGEQTRYDNVKISTNPDTFYFDGNTSDEGNILYQWTGPAEAATSTKMIARPPAGSAPMEATNLATNPTFNATLSGFVTTNAALYPAYLVTTAPISGAASALTVRSATSPSNVVASAYVTGCTDSLNSLPVVPGTPITGSLDVRTTQNNRSVNMIWTWLDASNASLGSTSVTTTQAPTIGTYRVAITGTPPAGAVAGYLTVAVYANSGNAVSAEEVRYDNVKMSTESDPTYFDGNTLDTDTTSYQWVGMPGASRSTKVLARGPKVTGMVTYDSGDEQCLPNEVRPLYDPLCPGVLSPPPPPAIEWACYSGPVNDIWNRYTVTVPSSFIPGWQRADPIITLTSLDDESRNIRIRFYPDPLDTGIVDPANPCGFDYEFIISFLPAGGALTIDGRDQVVYADVPGAARRRADSLIFASDGRPPDWKGLTCDQSYVMTLDLDPAQTEIPAVAVSFIERFGG